MGESAVGQHGHPVRHVELPGERNVVVEAAVDLGVDGLSPEARVAEAAYRAVEPDLAAAVTSCASGQELVAGGFDDDVAFARELDVTDRVPVLSDGAFAHLS